MTTPIKSLNDRLDRLTAHHTGPAFALEVSGKSELPAALSAWRRTHGGREPLMILVVPARRYEPANPTA